MAVDWFWEGNVSQHVSVYLQSVGWSVERIADTETRESGVDIRARKGDHILLVEVKGYRSKFYQRGEKKGQPKPTNPNTQARHWHGEILLSAILRQCDNPGADVAIAFPNFSTFTNLVHRT